MSHVMLDLEALGRAATSDIPQIAAVRFELKPGGAIDTENALSVHVKLSSQLTRTSDSETILWWASNPRGAEYILQMQRRAVPQDVAKAKIRQWFHDIGADAGKIEGVWAKPSYYDHALLDDFFAPASLPFPRKLCRDMWTWLADRPKVDTPQHERAHDALADAVAQAQHMITVAGLNAARDAVDPGVLPELKRCKHQGWVCSVCKQGDRSERCIHGYSPCPECFREYHG